MDDIFQVPEKPWTGSSIKTLRNEIVHGGEAVPGLDYATVYAWYSHVLVSVVERLKTIDYHSIIGEQPEISFRVKTVDTLRDKLIRQDATPLFRIHDIIGARITADMTLEQQDKLAQSIAMLFPKHQVSDMRKYTHSGYRAVHVIAGLPRGIFAEIQVRTLRRMHGQTPSKHWLIVLEETFDTEKSPKTQFPPRLSNSFLSCLTVSEHTNLTIQTYPQQVVSPQRVLWT
ncbi:hypothetical protein [Bifidobacterium felsineum]|uniref:RelA/SpoT domain-containing protein n=1 Tax=Bifidobacterium felsineum TaxID=2045440 RepID=A0A2M9HKZ5_9BIFI|nr:hypothetical protein [Bifidobacterium felsineum]PJM77486.1 hypothetical protein CSQ86_06365 [Bifidobacterium felsineum]